MNADRVLTPKLFLFYFRQMTMPNVLIAFVRCTVVPSQGRRRLHNLLNSLLFGSSVSRLDRTGG
jgi:hypothetical protein